MFRVLKWTTPVVAFALLLSLTTAARAQEATKETGSVSGTVLDKDGKPAAGVQVRLFHPFERGQRRGEAGKAQQQNADPGAAAPAEGEKPGKGNKGGKAGRPKPVASATTDNDGKFTMSDVPAGKYVVMAMLRGQGGARADVEVTAGGTATVELKLKERPVKGEKPAKKGGTAAE